MRYIIVGAGAIGGALGGRLAQHSAEHDADHPPILVARGEHGKTLARHGLRLRTPEEDSVIPVTVAWGPEDVRLSPEDVLVFATKTHQVQAALEQWVDAAVYSASGQNLGTAGDLLPVLMALNGTESERFALRLFARVFGVCVWMPSVLLTPGEIILRVAPTSGVFLIGRYGAAGDADAADDTAFLSAVERDWTAATFGIHLVPDVMRWKYGKLLSNLGNGLQALVAPSPAGDDNAAPSDTAPSDTSASDTVQQLAERLRAEAETIYRAAGIAWPGPGEESALRGNLLAIRPVPGEPAQLGGSTWQSIARGSGSIETDYLNGEIVLIARTLGLRAPLNETIQRLCRAAAASAAGVGSMTADQLDAILR